jgi:hypothetical protein
MLQKHRGEALNLARPEFINSDRGTDSFVWLLRLLPPSRKNDFVAIHLVEQIKTIQIRKLIRGVFLNRFPMQRQLSRHSSVDRQVFLLGSYLPPLRLSAPRE